MRISLLYLVCVISLALSLPATGYAEVIALVGEVPITSFELTRQTEKIMPFNVSYHGTVTDEKKQEVTAKALDDLIVRAYKINYAKSLKLAVEPGAVDKQLDAIKSRYSAEGDFQRAVKEETVRGLRDSIERALLEKIAEKKAVGAKVAVSDQDIRTFYDENKQMYFKSRQYRASHIFIKVEPTADEATHKQLLEKAQGLEKRAKAGEDFYNLAYYNSDDRTSYVGGDIGVFHEGQAGQELEDAMKKMEVGDISDVVESRYGFHIIKLTQRIEPRQMEFEDARPNIRALLEKNQRDALYQEWLENLKVTYPVKKMGSAAQVDDKPKSS